MIFTYTRPYNNVIFRSKALIFDANNIFVGYGCVPSCSEFNCLLLHYSNSGNNSFWFSYKFIDDIKFYSLTQQVAC